MNHQTAWRQSGHAYHLPHARGVGLPGATGLWLEAVDDEAGPDWSLDAFARAAFHCGRYTGTDLTGAVPADAPPPLNFRAQLEARVDALRLLGAERDHAILSRAAVDELAERATAWLDALTPDDVRRHAGLTTSKFEWLPTYWPTAP